MLGTSCTPQPDPVIRTTVPQSQVAGNAAISSGSEDVATMIRQVIMSNLEQRELSFEVNAAWQLMHGALAYGEELTASKNGLPLPVLQRLLGGHEMQGWELLEGDQLPITGRQGMKARLEPGSYIGQGHVDQWLGYLAQAGIPKSRTVIVGDKIFTMEDWARQAQWDVCNNPTREYSWTLAALSIYFPDEETWTASDGHSWSMETLVEFEAQQDLTTSPCGGSHRLMGLARALDMHRRLGKPMYGGWELADRKLREAIEYIRTTQNADGSFSCNFFLRPGQTKELGAAINSTGHLFEVIAFALPRDQLSEPWVERAAVRLCRLLQASSKADLDCGGLYHSLKGLKLYLERRYDSSYP